MSGLVLSGIVKRFDRSTPAVAGVSLEIEAGELFALIGPSGCGKTTLLRIVAGLERPDAGRVRAGDRDLTDLPPEKRGMAMVFQSYALFPHLNVKDNVAFGLGYAGVPRARRSAVALEHLERVGLLEYALRAPAELSGGQQQRVALARALAVSPRILLLDEPLSNLDARLRESTRADIKRILNEQEVTAVYVTHDQEEAMALASRIAVMNRGRIEQIGTPEEVHRQPVSDFVAHFVARASVVDAIVVEAEPQRARSGALPTIAVKCGALLLRATCAGTDGERASHAHGATVTVAIRPETLVATPAESVASADASAHAGAAPAAGAEAHAGTSPAAGALATITARAYLGATIAFVAQIKDGPELSGLAPADAPVPAAGARARITVREGGASIVQRATST